MQYKTRPKVIGKTGKGVGSNLFPYHKISREGVLRPNGLLQGRILPKISGFNAGEAGRLVSKTIINLTVMAHFHKHLKVQMIYLAVKIANRA